MGGGGITYAEEKYNLWVGGTSIDITAKLTSKDANDNGLEFIPSDDTHPSNTLKLTNYNYTGAGYKWDSNNDWYAAIFYNGSAPLIIELSGDNKITQSADNTRQSYGIYIDSATQFTISGDGSLDVSGGTATTYSYGICIYTYAQSVNISITGNANVRATGGDVTGQATNSYGINSNSGSVYVSGSAKVEATGGKANTLSVGIIANKTVSVTDSADVKATGGEGKYSIGIQASNGVVSVKGNAKVEAAGGVSTENQSYGIATDTGNASITIIEDKITVTASGNTGAFDEGKVKNAVKGAGWTDKDGTGSGEPIEITTDSQDLTAYKKVVFPYFTVSFDSNGGSAVDPITITEGNKTISKPASTKTGYSDEWYKESDFINEWNFATDTVTADITLYAKWKVNQYTLSFDTDGGTSISPVTQNYGTKITAPDNPTKTGYSFASWSPDVPATMPAENLTVKALWKINQYTLTFDTDGGTSISPVTQNYGTDITAPDNPAKTGYSFASWSPDIPATMPAKNLTVKALWKINQYTLTFDTDGGNSISPVTQDYGTDITAPDNPAKTGYSFASWSPDIPATMPAENLTVKALWKINQYTLTFDTDGGTSISPVTQDYGTKITAPDNPAKTGYSFASWSPDIPATMPAENLTVKALWKANQYTLTFDTDGGNSISPVTQNYGTKITAPAAPTKTGYSFAGWNPDIPATMPAKNLTVKALWIESADNTVTEDDDKKDDEKKDENESDDDDKKDESDKSEESETKSVITNPESITQMTDDKKLAQTFGGKSEIVLQCDIKDEAQFNEILKKIETGITAAEKSGDSAPESRTLDLSGVTGLKTVTIPADMPFDTVDLTGNKDVEEVNIADNKNIKQVNISGSSVQTFNAKGSGLENVNIENCANLKTVDISNTSGETDGKGKRLVIKNCPNLTEVIAENAGLREVNINGVMGTYLKPEVTAADLMYALNGFEHIDLSGNGFPQFDSRINVNDSKFSGQVLTVSPDYSDVITLAVKS